MSLDAAYRKLSGTDGRLFADPHPGPDEISFEVDNTSAAYYKSAYYELHKRDLQPVPEPRTPQPRVDSDAVLSGHAHLYQRFTRRVDGREIPYVVAGSGGFAATRPVGDLPPAPVTVGEYTLDKPPIVEFGYLTVAVDMSGRDHHLTITFHDRTNTHVHDTTHLNLKTGKILRR